MVEPKNAMEGAASIVWIEDGIIHVEAKGVPSTRETALEMFDSVQGLLDGTPLPALFDARKWPAGDPEMWVTVIANLTSTFSAIAMLLDPASPADVGEYPAVIDRLLIPFRTFTDEAEAIAFLERERDSA